jgi:hypothetical protein
MKTKQNITSMIAAQNGKNLTWEPTKALSPDAEAYFYDLLTCRASYDWSRGDVIALTRLSGWLAEADKLASVIERDGYTLTNAKGTHIMNPIFSAQDSLERRIISAMVKLAIFAVSSATTGKRPIIGERAKQARDAAENDGGDDDCIG